MDYRGPASGTGARVSAPAAGMSGPGRDGQERAGCQSAPPFREQEASADMTRVVRLIVVASTLSVLCGCAGPKWYRAIGSIPGVAWTDYAFTFYCDTATQLYPAAPGQIESSVLESLADLGYRDVAPPERTDGDCLIRCKAPDGRHVRVTVKPQNAMTMVAVAISPPIGDYQPSRPAPPRRTQFRHGDRASTHRSIRPFLGGSTRRASCPVRRRRDRRRPSKGRGLRPDVRREAISPDEITVPGSVVPPYMSVPGCWVWAASSRPWPSPTRPTCPTRPGPITPRTVTPSDATHRLQWRGAAERPIISWMVHRGPIGRPVRELPHANESPPSPQVSTISPLRSPHWRGCRSPRPAAPAQRRCGEGGSRGPSRRPCPAARPPRCWCMPGHHRTSEEDRACRGDQQGIRPVPHRSRTGTILIRPIAQSTIERHPDRNDNGDGADIAGSSFMSVADSTVFGTSLSYFSPVVATASIGVCAPCWASSTSSVPRLTS